MNKKLIIATANFGMNYGISVNQKKLLDKDIIDILVSAEKMGIETLDTAISYGDSIERLGNVGVQKFKIICKIPRIPFDVKNPSDWYKLEKDQQSFIINETLKLKEGEKFQYLEDCSLLIQHQ